MSVRLTGCFVLVFHISGVICCPVSLSSSAAAGVFNGDMGFVLYETSGFFGTEWHVVSKLLCNDSDGKVLDQVFKIVFNFDLLILNLLIICHKE